MNKPFFRCKQFVSILFSFVAVIYLLAIITGCGPKKKKDDIVPTSPISNPGASFFLVENVA